MSYSFREYPIKKTKPDSANFKHPKGLYVAFTGTYSSVDVYKNYLENPYKIGYSPRLVWEFSNTLRLSAETTFLPSFSYSPSWNNLRGNNTEINLQFMARIKNEHSIFYATVGLCRHSWQGDFVSQSVFYDEIVNYQPGTSIKKEWVGINTGVGVERAFKHFEIFAEYRYRFSRVDDALAVSDVAVCLGLKKKIPLKKIFRGLKDRYTWF
ncbi:MAG: hypothetical protein ACK5D5_05560 [Bacteroidota bacterium]|jgi:hypothetical protein